MMALVIKNLPAKEEGKRDAGLIPGSGWCPGRGHGNPLQYSCLENSIEESGGLQSSGSQRVRQHARKAGHVIMYPLINQGVAQGHFMCSTPVSRLFLDL